MAQPVLTPHAALTSPGAATSERAALELEMLAALTPALDAFAARVAQAAQAAPGQPFTLGAVLGEWGPVVAALTGVLTVHDLNAEYVTAAGHRLAALDLPARTYDSARAVLTLAAEQGWPPARIAAELATATDPETPYVQATAVPAPALIAALEPGPARGQSARTLARMVARTEATAAYGHATLRVIKAFGRPGKRWVAHHDKHTRPTHLAVSGAEVPADAAFIVGGYALMYPGDPSAPLELTANCRCVMSAVGPVTAPMG